MIFSVKQTKIIIDYSFFLLLSFAVFYGYKNAVMIILFSCLHELGHLTALLLFNAKPNYIKLSFYGISLNYCNKLGRIKELIAILCGPAVNLLLYLILKDEINLFLFIINMYPVLPLDGGRSLNTVFQNNGKFISLFFLVLLIGLSLYLLVIYKIWSLILIVIYLLIFNIKQMRFI